MHYFVPESHFNIVDWFILIQVFLIRNIWDYGAIVSVFLYKHTISYLFGGMFIYNKW